MKMKKYQLRRLIREVIERELNNSMFPIRDTQFDVSDEDGQKTFTTVKFFRDDNESLI